MVAGEPGGGDPDARQTRSGVGRERHRGDGDRRHLGFALGECEQKAGMHFSGRGFVHFELIEPETGLAKPMVDGAEGELVLTHLVNRSAPLLVPHPRPVRPRLGDALAGQNHGRCMGAPTTC